MAFSHELTCQYLPLLVLGTLFSHFINVRVWLLKDLRQRPQIYACVPSRHHYVNTTIGFRLQG